ncbi:UDP-N-acetylmuramoyl-tripeptide--D-alanyl-D-alanine ligase [Marinobacter daepoensis]|uniref:UDP-N-acetylmuramoyl-tripeptide--D-alanyl-D-alanine ligase n=1 Tax=Marinobacter daepoensis TaxID=262077 RepID=A0ABS3BJ53_9GAMM|nr:UDP-N-acetylmuramoyl-tripeptide--D-alanyl-D-alanine ligase [Marinobacter daepoensis]MBN7771596.1 UDP-N-acetylmuramoyl-tripeptide--D-alanyl-D-alanine ligase [Marinobacter daepoensis]MBY6080196.1 UDP-N-acetylmuramoyl-tripeptide--D-alanyl-D-alanine ligase [Marinobacter daepoensis]
MMRAFSLAEASRWLDARLTGLAANACDLCFEGVSTDTRSVAEGQLFVALRGDHFDGHRFLAQALAQGAVAAVVDTEMPDVAIPQLVVTDTVQALAELASGNRCDSQAELVAITGSSGKTTVREMTGAILAGMGPTLTTEGNLNNHIGVPLTLFRLSPEHEYGAVELGASGLGEIAHTVAIVQPRVAILTNAGQAHLEGFGSYQNIVQAKGEIIDGVVPEGTVVLNRDDPAFEQWRVRAGERNVVSVSRAGDREADYRAENIVARNQGFEFDVVGPENWRCPLTLGLPGEHNVTNALLALAASRALGATRQQVQVGLRQVQAVKGRLQVLTPVAGLTLIDDSYNANPASMMAALDVLATYPSPRVAVLGAMAELGKNAGELHRQVGDHARVLGIEGVLVVGTGGEGYAVGFGGETEFLQTHEQAVDAIMNCRNGAMTVLVKGSRSSAMDRVVEGIQKKVKNTCCSG